MFIKLKSSNSKSYRSYDYIGRYCKIERSSSPITIVRHNQTRQVSVTAIVGRDTATVNREIQTKLNQLTLPNGYTIEMGGEQEQMLESFRDLILAFFLAVALVYMVMAAQLNHLNSHL